MSSVLEKDKQHVWHPFTQMKTAEAPLDIVKSEGTLLIDRDGKEYIDCNSSWWVNVHGHCHPHIIKAVTEQISKIDHIIFADATHEPAVKLAERVCKILPESFQKVFFSDNGSTAIEVALKMVFQFWFNQGIEKKRILAIDGAYHGDTFGAMSVGERGFFNRPFEAFFFDVDYLDFPTSEIEDEQLQKAEELFKTGQFAGLIVEPLIQGSAGMRIYSADWLNKLVVLAQKYDVLVIFDEVMTAWGRTGKMFALEHCLVVPDIICLSKGLTGGVVPLGLTVTSDKIYNQFLSDETVKALLHGHSFTGNAIACACANASLDIFELNFTWKNIDRISKSHVEFIETIHSHSKVKTVRHLGTILAIEIEEGQETTYFSSIKKKAFDYFKENGMLLRPLGNVLYLNPPYCITEEQLSKVYSHLRSFLELL